MEEKSVGIVEKREGVEEKKRKRERERERVKRKSRLHK